MKMMRRIMLFGCLLVASASFADSHFTMGVNDTLLVYPNKMDDNIDFPVHAYFNGYVDEWSLTFTYPSGMVGRDVSILEDMYIPYLNAFGTEVTLIAPISVSWNYTEVASQIWTFGYWDFDQDGNMEPYGTVKWAEGYYNNMFELTFQFDSGFTGGYLLISGSVKSSSDYRQHLVDPNPTSFTKTIVVKVGYLLGDVDGDESITMSDVNTVTAYLLDPDNNPLDEYQLEAADFNQDGYVTINDVTAIINYLLTH